MFGLTDLMASQINCRRKCGGERKLMKIILKDNGVPTTKRQSPTKYFFKNYTGDYHGGHSHMFTKKNNLHFKNIFIQTKSDFLERKKKVTKKKELFT